MIILVATILVFLTVGVLFLAANLVVGWLVRPNRPNPDKLEIYECGEEPIGSAWGQFDLRFYVVALLFVIFDVEMVFFFPWAVVFGSVNRAGQETLPTADRLEATGNLTLPGAETVLPEPGLASAFAGFAFLEMVVFFSILLMGFAYLWRRGDLEWVRSTAAQDAPPSHEPAGV